MKIRLFALAIAAVLAGLLWAGPVRAQSASAGVGPVCCWDFDGSLEDRAGSSSDGLTPRGGKLRFSRAVEVPGIEGQAVALGVKAGDAKYLTAATSADVKLGPNYTIEAWIYPIGVAQWNRLVLRWGPEQYAYHLAIHQGRLSLCHGQSDGKYVFAEGGQIVPGQWYHVAAVAQKDERQPARSTLKVYLNGRPTGAGTFDGTTGALEREGLGVGDSASMPDARSQYRGYLDELTIWNRALGAEEIRAHYAERAEIVERIAADRRKRELEKHTKAFAKVRELGVDEIVFACRHPGRDPSGHYYANFGYSCIDPDYWLHGQNGGKLCKLNVRTGELEVLLDDPEGGVRDPQVHYDAEKILFSYRKSGTHSYNLYEIGADGSGLRQITRGPWEDIEPTYLPDGDIIFCSSRCKRWIGCWLSQAATLHRCEGDGKNIRMISSGAFTENTPAVMPDGRVIYTRWEYVNRDPVVFHHLWAISPDGTGQMTFFGNMHPGGVFIDAQPIPRSEELVLIHSPSHGRNEHEGSVVTLTHKRGPDAKAAMRTVSRSRGFRDPCALSADVFLVARANQVLLMDSRGQTEVLYADPQMPVHEPRPVVKRPRERVIPQRIDLSKATGTLVLDNVYLGRNMAGIEPGAIKKLLVLEDLPKPANFHGGGSQPIGHGVTSTLKRILGTVPVEPDGSAHFEVPAMRSIYLAALDENDLSVKQMRSFVTLQPGETASCIGCHEQREGTPRLSNFSALAATVRPPSIIEPIEDVPEVMDFPRDVQPILDRHCVRCHGHKRRDGGVSLVGNRGPVFSHSYYELLLHWQVKDTGGNPGHRSGRQPGNDRPYSAYSSASPLMKMIDGSHYDVEVSALERKTIRLWIDTSAQYAGTYAAYGTGQVGGCWGNNRPVRVMADAWPCTPPAVEAVGRRCGECHSGRQLPGHVTAQIAMDHGDMLSWTRPLSRYSRHRIYNLTRPEKSLILLSALSRKAGGYAEAGPGSKQSVPRQVGEDRSRPPEPIVHPIVFADTGDPDYRRILTHIQAAKAKLDEIKRFDMPGFRPNEHYVREMKRYGVLPQDLPEEAAIDVYAADAAYWRSMWHRPKADTGQTHR